VQELELHPGCLQQRCPPGGIPGGTLELGRLRKAERVEVFGDRLGIIRCQLEQLGAQRLGSIQHLLGVLVDRSVLLPAGGETGHH
jgi:hypothetical protein